MGLFTDAYDLFSITLIIKMMGRIYYDHRKGENQFQTPPLVTSALVAAALLGTAVGQLLFGRLGDLKGRRRVYGFALLLMVYVGAGDWWGLPSVFNDNVGVCEQEDTRVVHSGGVFDARVRHIGQLHRDGGGVLHFSCGVEVVGG
ncbi:hypothetical protein V8G54_001580 [Vigna mungo]|uniref:Major facilitator superfamily (MFS) profile domain-containing protein n=1 Tax=Vigna mungo TaxID=3915 RepID=A0AAQ3P6K8_VIGMU